MAWHTLTALLAALLAASPTFAAKLYKWVDEAGNVSYQDRPPPPGQGRVEERPYPVDRAAAAAEPDARLPKVTLYVIPDCDACDQARTYLQSWDLEFTEKNVSSEHPDAQAEMKKKIGQLTVPVISVGDKAIRGFIEPSVRQALEDAGYARRPAEQ